LHHGRSVRYSASGTSIALTYSDEITAAQLAIDRQIEHC
jgi:hypothetical protein